MSRVEFLTILISVRPRTWWQSRPYPRQHFTPATRHLGLPPATRDAAMLSHRFSHRCLHRPSAHGRDAVAPLPLPPLVSFL